LVGFIVLGGEKERESELKVKPVIEVNGVENQGVM